MDHHWKFVRSIGKWKCHSFFDVDAAGSVGPDHYGPGHRVDFKIRILDGSLSTNADFTAAVNPFFGDRVYDTEQNGFDPLATYVDINNDGISSNPFGDPPVYSLTDTEWTLVETTYEVDDSSWGYALRILPRRRLRTLKKFAPCCLLAIFPPRI